MSTLSGAAARKAGAATNCPRPMAPGLIKVVAHAISHAWAVISSDPHKHLVLNGKKPTEDAFTYAIAEILQQMLAHPELSVSGFTSEVFGGVTRGGAVANVSHTVLTKQPDLMVRLAKRDQYDLGSYIGIFIEAKIVTSGVSGYTDNGIFRFVDGQYAWAMRDGLMLAYQAKSVTKLSTLRARLKSHKPLAAQVVDSHTGDVLHEAPMDHVCAKSMHERSWTYEDRSKPGAIQLWHLWRLVIPASIWPASTPRKSPVHSAKTAAKTGSK